MAMKDTEHLHSDFNARSDLPDLSSYSLYKSCMGHTGPVPDVRFSHDDAMLASAGGDRTARTWDVAHGGKEVLRLHHPTEDGGVNAVSWSADGRLLATASDDYIVRVWDVASGKCVWQLEGHTHWATSVCFSPTGNWLASCSFDETVRIWCLHTGKEIRVIPAHSDPIMAIDVTRCTNCPLLLSVSLDGTSRVWNPIMGECLTTLETPKTFLPINGMEDGCKRDDGSPPPAVASGCFVPNNEYVLVSSLDSRVRLWDIKGILDATDSLGIVKKTYIGHYNTRHAIHTGLLVDRDPHGDHARPLVVVGSEDHHVYTYDLQTKKIAGILRGRQNVDSEGDGHCDIVLGIGTGHKTPILASSGGSKDAAVKIWKRQDLGM